MQNEKKNKFRQENDKNHEKERKQQDKDKSIKEPPNPPHIKRYSFNENYEFIAEVWQAVAEKEEYKHFGDLMSDDLIGFFKAFDKIKDKKQFFSSNIKYKRFCEVRQRLVRQHVLKEVSKMQKQLIPHQEIEIYIKNEAQILLPREQQRLLDSFRKFHTEKK